jgi:plasmid segregation protein ParM
MSIEILGYDAGGNELKIYGERGPRKILSLVGEWRPRNLISHFSEDDVEFEFNGRKGFFGTLAKYESKFATTRGGDTKAHDEFVLRVLIGLSLYSRNSDFKLIVGQPISKHIEEEKNKMKELLIKTHRIVVNGEQRIINILDAGVAAEGASAYFAEQTLRPGKVRILDFGSGTVNAATLIDGNYIGSDSFTIVFKVSDPYNEINLPGIAQYVISKIDREWDREDQVLICGGATDKMIDHIQSYFPNTKKLEAKIRVRDGSRLTIQPIEPIYANAIGFYYIAKRVFGQ